MFFLTSLLSALIRGDDGVISRYILGVGQVFWGFQSSRRRRGSRPNMGTENKNFLRLLKSMILGALWFRLGLLCISIRCFLKSDENGGVMAPNAGRENDPNLPITSPNFNKIKTSFIR